jgi:hypothetical protein
MLVLISARDQNNVKHIDLLKRDVEGHKSKALKVQQSYLLEQNWDGSI